MLIRRFVLMELNQIHTCGLFSVVCSLHVKGSHRRYKKDITTISVLLEKYVYYSVVKVRIFSKVSKAVVNVWISRMYSTGNKEREREKRGRRGRGG